MAGKPSAHDTPERMTRDMAHQKALAQSARRATSTANNRIQLNRPKMTAPTNIRHTSIVHHDHTLLGRKETNHAPPVRRSEFVDSNEFLAPQRSADTIGHHNNIVGNEGFGYNRMDSSRKRLAVNADDYKRLKETRLHDPINPHSSSSNDPSWELGQCQERLRQCQEELRVERERVQLYKERLAEITLEYEELKSIRLTEPEKALGDFQHWTQNTEEAYLELRDQLEIVMNKSKEMGLGLDGGDGK